MHVKFKKKQLKVLIAFITLAIVVEGVFAFINKEGIFSFLGDRFERYPEFVSSPYAVINGNVPYFDESQKNGTTAFEYYGELDRLGRCTEAVACIGLETMPAGERGDISSVKPTGWRICMYDFIEGEYLYNRCHLIGFQLTGENANEKNLITGTRYMNVEGMLPFENMVADYVEETGNHVIYRVTPVFKGNDLVAQGVYMEAYSVEDDGEGVCFCVFVYNVQPNVRINYLNGLSIQI